MRKTDSPWGPTVCAGRPAPRSAVTWMDGLRSGRGRGPRGRGVIYTAGSLRMHSRNEQNVVEQVYPHLKKFIIEKATHVNPGSCLALVYNLCMKVALSCPTLCNPMDYTSQWNSPGQNTGEGSLSLLQGIFPTQE